MTLTCPSSPMKSPRRGGASRSGGASQWSGFSVSSTQCTVLVLAALACLTQTQLSTAASERTALFAIKVDIGTYTGDFSKGKVPLVIYEGDKPSVVANAFALAHGLDAKAAGEIETAIIKTANHNASKNSRAKSELLFALNFNMPSGKTEQLAVFEGDVPNVLAAAFVSKHGLAEASTASITEAIVNKHKVLFKKPAFELPITMPSGATEKLPVYAGERADVIAVNFARTHKLSQKAQQAIQDAIVSVAAKVHIRIPAVPVLKQMPAAHPAVLSPSTSQRSKAPGDTGRRRADSLSCIFCEALMRWRHLSYKELPFSNYHSCLPAATRRRPARPRPGCARARPARTTSW